MESGTGGRYAPGSRTPFGIRHGDGHSSEPRRDGYLQTNDGDCGAADQCLDGMARVTGLEPATSGVTGRRSNRLSYTPATV